MNEELLSRVRDVLERPHRLGMIGGELEEQLAHCASFSRVLGDVLDDMGEGSPDDRRAVDIGTGGGVPGVALAAWWSELDWAFVEMRSSRATELERAVLRLGLDVEVRTEPAQVLGQESGWRETATIVVARAFGPTPLTTECAAGLLRVGGALIVSEPPHSVATERWPSDGCGALGFMDPTMFMDNDNTFAVLRKSHHVEQRYPRLPPRADRGWPSD